MVDRVHWDPLLKTLLSYAQVSRAQVDHQVVVLSAETPVQFTYRILNLKIFSIKMSNRHFVTKK
mgnify:CR=1 FL=1